MNEILRENEGMRERSRKGREITYSLNGHREKVTVCGVGVNVMTTPTKQTTVRKPLT